LISKLSYFGVFFYILVLSAARAFLDETLLGFSIFLLVVIRTYCLNTFLILIGLILAKSEEFYLPSYICTFFLNILYFLCCSTHLPFFLNLSISSISSLLPILNELIWFLACFYLIKLIWFFMVFSFKILRVFQPSVIAKMSYLNLLYIGKNWRYLFLWINPLKRDCMIMAQCCINCYCKILKLLSYLRGDLLIFLINSNVYFLFLLIILFKLLDISKNIPPLFVSNLYSLWVLV